MSGGLAVVAMPLAAQVAPEEPSPDSAIEWNFRPADAPLSGDALRQRWAAPFAVESRGTTAPRPARPVVVLHDSAAARRAVDSVLSLGESAAEVLGAPGEGDAMGAAGSPVATSSAADAESPDAAGPPVAAAPASEAAGSAPDAGGQAAGAMATPPAVARPESHLVAYGETWYGIANRYGVPSRALASANPQVDPERLRAGTRLRIPAGESATQVRTHTVVRGDTLFGIARRYDVSPEALRTANRMTDDVVRLGQTLTIPPEEAIR